MADDAVLHLRLDACLKRAFAEAARAQDVTPSQVMRDLIIEFVRRSRRAEAGHQSRLVATAPDAEATMDEVTRVQAWLFE